MSPATPTLEDKDRIHVFTAGSSVRPTCGSARCRVCPMLNPAVYTVRGGFFIVHSRGCGATPPMGDSRRHSLLHLTIFTNSLYILSDNFPGTFMPSGHDCGLGWGRGPRHDLNIYRCYESIYISLSVYFSYSMLAFILYHLLFNKCEWMFSLPDFNQTN